MSAAIRSGLDKYFTKPVPRQFQIHLVKCDSVSAVRRLFRRVNIQVSPPAPPVLRIQPAMAQEPAEEGEQWKTA